MFLELELSNVVNYVFFFNMYVVGVKWENMFKVRFLMRLVVVKKEVGCSWVIMKDGVYVFVVGDKLYFEKDVIYGKFEEF